MARGLNHQKVPRGVIHITGGLVVPADTGCHLWPNCLTCPFPRCYLDMTLSEKNQFTRQRKVSCPAK